MIAVTIRRDPLSPSTAVAYRRDDLCRRADQYRIADLGLAAGMTIDRRAGAVNTRRQCVDVECLEAVTGDEVGRRSVDAVGGHGSTITADEPVAARHTADLLTLRQICEENLTDLHWSEPRLETSSSIASDLRFSTSPDLLTRCASSDSALTNDGATDGRLGLELFDDEFIQDPYPLYARMLADGPVHPIGDSGFHAVCTWDAVNEVVGRPEDSHRTSPPR